MARAAHRRHRAARALLGVATFALVACGGDRPASAPGGTARYAPDGRLPGGPVVPTAPRNVLLICLDTVRADAFAPWAEGPPAMPETSAWFASRGVAFRQATTPAPWTAPAIASLLTGLLPSGHGTREMATDVHVLPGVVTIAEILSGAGWQAAAFTGGGWVSKASGMLQGFRYATDPFAFQTVGEQLLLATKRVQASGRWFVFAHTYEAHDPYLAPPPVPGQRPPPPPPYDLAAIDREAEADGGRSLARRFLLEAAARIPVFGTATSASRMKRVTRYFDRGWREDPEGPALAAEARRAYEEGLRRIDAPLAAFLRSAERAGLLSDAVVVLASDHGEAFGEHGMLHHGRWLHEELVRVPLYVAAPGWPAGKVVEAPCSLMDVLPTVLDLVGLPRPEGIDGRSLVPLVLEGAPGRPAPSEERRTEAETGFADDDVSLFGLRDGRWKWVRSTDHRAGTVVEQTWDLAADPASRSPLPAGAQDRLPEAFREAIRARPK